MADIFVISDTHFGHENILNFTDSNTGQKVRSFYDVFEMDETMIKNWNAVVKPQDKAYHLGDVFLGSGKKGQRPYDIMARLNGHKRLIVGNHDDIKAHYLYKSFDKISLWRDFREFGLLLTHVPVHRSTLYEGRFEGERVNVHGHIHQNPSPEGPYKCVCVEQVNYTPVNIEELRIR